MFGHLFSSSLQKVAFSPRMALAAPVLAAGAMGPGIEYASMGMLSNPFNTLSAGDQTLYDKSVRDHVIKRDGDYWSAKGTDIGDPVVMEHLKYNIPISAMSSRMPDVQMNKHLDQTGVLSKEMQSTGEMARFRPGASDSPDMLAKLSPKQKKELEDYRFDRLKRMTGNTITPHMVAGAQARMAQRQQQQ